MKFAVCFFLALALAGCGRKSDEIAGDVSGQPIASGTANAGPKTNAAAKTEKLGDYHVVGFDKLAGYSFEVSDELLAPVTNNAAMAQRVDSQIPATVKAFNEKPVALKGFMLPLKVEGGLVTELLIMRGEMRENGYLVGIYSMDGDKMEAPE